MWRKLPRYITWGPPPRESRNCEGSRDRTRVVTSPPTPNYLLQLSAERGTFSGCFVKTVAFNCAPRASSVSHPRERILSFISILGLLLLDSSISVLYLFLSQYTSFYQLRSISLVLCVLFVCLLVS